MMDHEAWKEKLSVLNEVSLTEQRSRAIWTNVENVINEAQTAKSSKRIHLYRRLMVGVSGMVAVLLVGILLTHEHFFAPSAEKTSAVKKHAQPSTQTASQFVTQYVNDLKHGDIAAAEACIAPEIRNRIWLLPTTKHEQWRVKPSSSGELRKKNKEFVIVVSNPSDSGNKIFDLQMEVTVSKSGLRWVITRESIMNWQTMILRKAGREQLSLSQLLSGHYVLVNERVGANQKMTLNQATLQKLGAVLLFWDIPKSQMLFVQKMMEIYPDGALVQNLNSYLLKGDRNQDLQVAYSKRMPTTIWWLVG